MVKILTSLESDLFVVVAYGQILPPEVLSVPKKFCVNVHGSLLPQYRGAGPINWAVLNGEKETGITIMKMNPALDEGDIISQETIAIGDDETAPQLRLRMMELGCRLLVETLDNIERDRVQFLPQNARPSGQVLKPAPKLTKDLGHIRWEKTAQEQFQKLLEQIPDLVRGIAETRVSKKAESIVREQNRSVISEKDMVEAFFAETPSGFIAPMKSSMRQLGIDYTQYGYPK